MSLLKDVLYVIELMHRCVYGLLQRGHGRHSRTSPWVGSLKLQVVKETDYRPRNIVISLIILPYPYNHVWHNIGPSSVFVFSTNDVHLGIRSRNIAKELSVDHVSYRLPLLSVSYWSGSFTCSAIYDIVERKS